MAETTELFDNLLKLELLDHYERMTTKKRMSSVSMQQWLVGAAFHLHVRIHQVRLRGMHFISSIASFKNVCTRECSTEEQKYFVLVLQG